ncbi:MAG: hypothetical protein PVJ57_20250 [Phycisphaerae bacterium]
MPVATGLWQVGGCAGLCGFGVTLGLIVVLDELGYHVARPGHVAALAATALGAGVVLGFWLPRVVIRRRLPALADAPASVAEGGVAPEFAASLVGGVVLAGALLWTVLCGMAWGMESYRAFLTRHFVLPASTARAVLLLPLSVGLAFAGASAATTLTALRGWLRVRAPMPHAHALLWAIMLAAMTLAGTVAFAWPQRNGLTLVALLASFSAAIFAVGRLRRRGGAASPRPSSRPAADIAPAEQEQPYDNTSAAGVAVVSACSAGLALAGVLTGELPEATQLGRMIAVAAGGALIGLLLGRWVLRWKGLASALLVVLFGTGGAWALMLAVHGGGLLRLSAATICAAAGLVLVGARLRDVYGSTQRALAYTGSVTAAIGGAAALAAGVWPARLGVNASTVLVVLLATAAAGLVLANQRTGRRRWSVGGAVVLGIWLVLLVGVYGSAPGAAPTGTPPTSKVFPLVQWIGNRPGSPIGRICAARFPAAGCEASAWDVDLGGPRWALLTITPTADGTVDADLSRRLGRRVVQRCTRALARGGHLLLELPAGALAHAAQDVARQQQADGWSSYLLRVAGPPHAADALVVGPDVPAWVAQQPWPADVVWTLYEVPRRRDLEWMLNQKRQP